MYILGISCYYHNSAVCLLKDGIPVALVEEERFTRKKNDSSFPQKSIEYCLKIAKIKSRDLDYVVFYEKPFLKFERLIRQSLIYWPNSWKLFRESMLEWLTKKLWLKEKLITSLNLDESKIFFCDHHLSHAASAFLASPFDKAAILTLDGVGEWSTTTVGKGTGSNIELYEEIRFPHSIGLLYSAFTAFLGFEVNEGEYKVMGMAAFGKPRYVAKIKKVIKIFKDGSFKLNLEYFAYQYSPEKSYSEKFTKLFGQSRVKSDHFFTRGSGYPKYFGKKPKNYVEQARKNEYYADLAASLQYVTEEIIFSLVKYALEKAGSKNLCMAGGVALNSLANGKIVSKLGIKNIFIQPAAGDSGASLGAALYLYSKLTSKRQFKQTHNYYGAEYRKAEILTAIRKFDNKLGFNYYSDEKKLIKTVIDNLVNKKVIGWFQGKFEWGPRALGNRSIIADPRYPEMKDVVNTMIKFREPYRPFAPSVLIEDIPEYFDYSFTSNSDPTKFMLIVANIKKEKRKLIPAVTHVDGTGRLQAVDRDTNIRYYNLIKAFKKRTGIPLILNTSFNLRGEPIVNTPENAINTFLNSGMDLLVLGNYLIRKNNAHN